MTGIGIAQVRLGAENLPITPVRPTNLCILPLLLLLGLQRRPLKCSYWFSTTLQSASWFYSRLGTKKKLNKWQCEYTLPAIRVVTPSLFYQNVLTESLLLSYRHAGEHCGVQISSPWETWSVCNEMNEWESCVWACVCVCALILCNLHYDSLIGGFWAQGVGWFKCWKTTCVLPGFAVHTNAAAAAAASFNQTKGSSASASAHL